MGQLSDRVCSAAQGHHGQKGSGQPAEDGKAGGLGVALNHQLFTLPREEFTSDARRAGLGGRKCSGGVREATGLCGLQLGPRHVHLPRVCT